MLTHILISQTAPSIPLDTVIWAVLASTGGVAIAMVAVIKLLASFLPSVDSFFSSKGRKSKRSDSADISIPTHNHDACDSTRDILKALSTRQDDLHAETRANSFLLKSLVKALEPLGLLAEEIKIERAVREREEQRAAMEGRR